MTESTEHCGATPQFGGRRFSAPSSAALTAVVCLEQSDSKIPSSLLFNVGMVVFATVVSGMIGVALTVKDRVRRRRAEGLPVHPILHSISASDVSRWRLVSFHCSSSVWPRRGRWFSFMSRFEGRQTSRPTVPAVPSLIMKEREPRPRSEQSHGHRHAESTPRPRDRRDEDHRLQLGSLAGIAAGNPPVVNEQMERTHQRLLKFRQWLDKRKKTGAELNADGSVSEGDGSDSDPFPAFRKWLTTRESKGREVS